LRAALSLQTFAARQSEHEARYSVDRRLGSPIAAYEYETAPPIPQRQDRGVSTVRGDRRHRDIKRFAEWLIAILQPQLYADLSRAQLKTNSPCAFVHIGKRRFIRFHAELRG